jgi:hypothetical protein
MDADTRQPNQFRGEDETIDMKDTIQFQETGKKSSNRFQFSTSERKYVQ